MEFFGSEASALVTMAITGISYGLGSEIVGALPIKSNTLAGLVFRLMKMAGGKVREKIFGKKE